MSTQRVIFQTVPGPDSAFDVAYSCKAAEERIWRASAASRTSSSAVKVALGKNVRAYSANSAVASIPTPLHH